MTIYLQDKELQKVVAEGKPVRFEQQRVDEETIHGQSHRLDYDAEHDELLLLQSAELWQGDNRFGGERILYNVSTEKVIASGAPGGATDSGQRVQVTIQPKAKDDQAGTPKP